MIFSDRLKELRTLKELNQRECAEALDVESSKYNKWESGKNRPDYETVCKIANFFNTTTDYLFGLSSIQHGKAGNIDDFGEFVKLLTEFAKSEAIKHIELHPNFSEFENSFSKMMELYKSGTIDENLLNLWCNDQIQNNYKNVSIKNVINKKSFSGQISEVVNTITKGFEEILV